MCIILVMKVYQPISPYEKFIMNLEVTVDNASSGFSVAAGVGLNGNELQNTGFIFSGYEGYIFDQNENFVGGYSKDIPFNISVHTRSDGSYSYFIDEVLIANNVIGEINLDLIEFEKHGDSSLFVDYIHDPS